MKKCPEHGVELVFGEIEISPGRWKGGFFCPVCYNLKKFEFKCDLCGFKTSYYASKPFYKSCPACRGTGKRGLPHIYKKNIPTWRLNLDDASEEEILKKDYREFGIQPMSEEKWKEYYSQPWEQEKERQFKEKKKKLIKEALSIEPSPDESGNGKS